MIYTDQMLSLKNVQSLVMMPKLQQAIHILQLSNIDLAEFIESFVEKNPFIIRKDNFSRTYEDKKSEIINQIESKQSIYEIVANEIAVLAKSQEELLLMNKIFAGTNISTGIIEVPLKDISYECNVSLDYINFILGKMQGISLTGFFSRDIKEKISLKLGAINKLDSSTKKVIENLELITEKNIHALARKCNISLENAINIVMNIASIRPFATFDDIELCNYIIPDVIITETFKDCWSIKLNPQTLPHLLIDREYEEVALSYSLKNDDANFIRENIVEADWLIKSLNQRSQTILKVTKEIFRKQKMFFLYGPEYLEPMTLRTVSDSLGIHESTVSRATSNKYIMTRFGVFSFKSFFSNSLSNNITNDKVASSVIKRKIQKIIDSENVNKTYSDDEIVEKLLRSGIFIARRTVTKYRAAMNIPSYKSRKKTKLITN